jgi:hypothetical protein
MRSVRPLFAVAALVSLAEAPAWCREVQAAAPAEENEVAVTGTYRNPMYAYSMQVPAGLRGHRMKAPAPNHGIDVKAPGNETDTLWVDGSFDAAGCGSAEACAKRTAGFYKGEYGLRQVAISRCVLSGLDARKVVFAPRGRPAPGRINYVTFIVAFRQMGDDITPIIYAVGVLASTRDSAVLKAFPVVVGSLRILPWSK